MVGNAPCFSGKVSGPLRWMAEMARPQDIKKHFLVLLGKLLCADPPVQGARKEENLFT